jgi:hypothetical protein
MHERGGHPSFERTLSPVLNPLKMLSPDTFAVTRRKRRIIPTVFNNTIRALWAG